MIANTFHPFKIRYTKGLHNISKTLKTYTAKKRRIAELQKL